MCQRCEGKMPEATDRCSPHEVISLKLFSAATGDVVVVTAKIGNCVAPKGYDNAELEAPSGGNIELDPAQHTAFERTKKLTYGPVYVRATGNLRLQMPLRSQPSNGRES
jgi:hypothetical protein